LATASAPIAPPAPPLLSTVTGWPMLSDMRCATSRATMSVVPPAGKGRNNVHVQGKGPPMVFVHGFGCDQNMWRLLAPHFAESTR
jgi:pimeloyl-ACP methyl ester carboxylesterase